MWCDMSDCLFCVFIGCRCVFLKVSSGFRARRRRLFFRRVSLVFYLVFLFV